MFARVVRNSCFALIGTILLPFAASAATLRVVPASVALQEGETIPISIVVASADQAMNAASGILKFSPEFLQVVSISKSGSIIGVWVQEPSFSNTAGSVQYEGIALNPGYQGSAGTVLTVTFRARTEGTATISLTESSVLANDGNGTEILTGTSGASVAIKEAEAAPVKTTPAPTKTTAPAETPPPQPAPVLENPEPAPKSVVEHGYDPRRLFSWATRGTLSPALVLLALLIIAFLVIDVLLLLLYLRMRERKGGKLEHAQVLTHRSFLLLRDDVDSFVKELEAESGTRKLSPTEDRFVKEMRGDLSDSEKAIVRELREAEKKIK